MKRTISVLVAAMIATSAHAEMTVEETSAVTLGAIIGAVAGQNLGSGNGRTAMTAVGTIAGAKFFYDLTKPKQLYPAAAYNYKILGHDNFNCYSDGYYKGEFNPAAAQARCRGMHDGQQQRQARVERDAYIEGMRSQQQILNQAYQQSFMQR